MGFVDDVVDVEGQQGQVPGQRGKLQGKQEQDADQEMSDKLA